MDMGDGHEEEAMPLLGGSSYEIETTIVYPIIHQMREDAIHYIDTPLNYDALTAPDLTYTLVRPLTNKYLKSRNMAVPFCLLFNRAHFLRDHNIATRSLSQSRAELCEILAIRTLRHWADSTIELAVAMTTSWRIFNGASDEVLAKIDASDDELDENQRVGNAIELAIIGDAKRFIKSAASQKVIDGIWYGKIVYTAESDHAILSDTYKRTPVHFYDPHRAPLLDHYRLKVPAVRSVLEYVNFLILFILFVIALETSELTHINTFEVIFMIYAFGFTIDKLASLQEHGLKVYSANLWNGFDLAFICTYIPYVALRLYGARHHDLTAKQQSMELGIDILALAACFMFPRLAFVTLSNNLMILSLRSMIVEFAVLMLLAIFCFGGFLYALWTFGKAKYDPSQIAWWMADLWFGLDASGFEKASTFHPVFGPPLMAIYACLSNTLLVTVLVSILSHTFSSISADAAAESMFRRAVSTIEGVKADALFSYQPPLNIFAFLVMYPASFILTPRWFHKLNVAMIRITAFPILLIIAFYERQTRGPPKKVSERVSGLFDKLPRVLRPMTIFEGLAGVGADIDAVFEIEAQVLDDELNEQQQIFAPAARVPLPQNQNRDRDQPPIQMHDLNQNPNQTPPQSSPIRTRPSPTPLINTSPLPRLGTTPPQHRSFPSPSHSSITGAENGMNGAPSNNNNNDTFPNLGSNTYANANMESPRPLPRHVRTRRESIQQIHQKNAAAFNLGPDMTGPGAFPSPLGQLFGTVVVEEDSPFGSGNDSPRSASGHHRRVSFSHHTHAGSLSDIGSGNGATAAAPGIRRRRVSSNVNIPLRHEFPSFPAHPSQRDPETVQELEDEEEEDAPEAERERMRAAMEGFERRQREMQDKLDQVIGLLQRQSHAQSGHGGGNIGSPY